NGLGSMVASIFGSCYPTTIYIGHPGWKALGARSGYSILNGVFFTVVALLGLSSLMAAAIPIESGMAIVLWIGVIITAQAFQAVKRSHAPAVAIGLFPAIAGWGVLILTQTLGAVGNALGDFGVSAKVLANHGAFQAAGLNIDGLVALSQGFMLTCIVWSSISVSLIERKFHHAVFWATLGAIASYFGFIHAGHLGPSGGIYEIGIGTGSRWATGYLLVAILFALTFWWYKKSGQGSEKKRALH
ncbi:NCS2 family permease, partial [Myxococcota bacterium]|nr:NCS2 family permease [Myxococcota bacterium]